jgi:hypothetical protein
MVAVVMTWLSEVLWLRWVVWLGWLLWLGRFVCWWLTVLQGVTVGREILRNLSLRRARLEWRKSKGGQKWIGCPGKREEKLTVWGKDKRYQRGTSVAEGEISKRTAVWVNQSSWSLCWKPGRLPPDSLALNLFNAAIRHLKSFSQTF